MDQSNSQKRYPASTDEVAKMLGLPASGQSLPMGSFVTAGDLPVANLPVAPVEPLSAESQTSAVHQPASGHQPAVANRPVMSAAAPAAQSKFVQIGKQALPYAAIFAVGVFLYYFFFSSLNISLDLSGLSGAFSTSTPQAQAAPQQTAIQQLQQQDAASYQSWIKGFYYDVNDPSIIDPNTDNSGNGLTNFEKYLLGLNPKSYDSLGLGMPDSEALAEGIDPTTGAPLSSAKQAIISKYIDMEAVNNRLTLENLQKNSGQIAGANIGGGPAGFPTFANPAAGGGTVSPRGGSQNPAGTGAVSVGLGSSSSPDVNTKIPGQLIIPDLSINVPIIWSQSPNDFETDLQSGAVHYPGTAMPGQFGTTYIAAHSSNYPWAKGSYNQIFSTLGKLGKDASFQITVTTLGGQKITYHYVVVRSQQYSPTDQSQFASTGQSLVALSTCWPVDSTAKRLVVFGQLTQVNQ